MRILWQSFTASGSTYLRLLQDALRALAGDQVEVVVAGLERPHPYIHRLSEAAARTNSSPPTWTPHGAVSTPWWWAISRTAVSMNCGLRWTFRWSVSVKPP
ncbi:hypothetical protein [Fodinicola feengrottensis]|uniref:hypothetical protein n=1 Tax=Fodinicola feengrottensis TaxID=435914 RepID=UPI0013D12212|nr:hypothetical protein [Fodinicola feengrottensis]